MKNLLFWIVYYLISGILLFSGINKIFEPQQMLDSIKVLINISEDLQIIIATLLPVIEITLGIMLLIKKNIEKTLTAVTILFIFFFLISVYGNAIGLQKECGCFGETFKSQFGTGMIIRNAFFLLASVSLKKYYNKVPA